MADIKLLKPIPDQIINEGAAFRPLDLKQFIELPQNKKDFRFIAGLADGRPLPQGLICTSDGILTGIPAKGTEGVYEIALAVEGRELEPFAVRFNFTIKGRIIIDDPNFLSRFKSEVWEALAQGLPVPDLGQAFDRPITPVEIYYLLERWATLTIWDAYNLEAPGDKQPLRLKGMSQHYHIYDCGSCLIGAPKDLFSHDRTLEDALQTSRAMAREAYQRKWTVELVGFDKMARAAWIELQHLGAQHGKQLEIMHYTPRPEDIKLFEEQQRSKKTLGL